MSEIPHKLKLSSNEIGATRHEEFPVQDGVVRVDCITPKANAEKHVSGMNRTY